MAFSKALIDRQTFTGTLTGTTPFWSASFNVAVPTDRIVLIVVVCLVGSSSGGHLNGAGCVLAEAVYENDNGTVSAPNALSGSNNPATSGNLAPAHAMAADFTPSIAWSTSGTNAVVTINATSTPTRDFAAFVDLYEAGYA